MFFDLDDDEPGEEELWQHDWRCSEHIRRLASHEAPSYSLATWATRYNHPKIISAIISRGFLKNGVWNWDKRLKVESTERAPPLYHQAAEYGSAEVLDILMERFGSVNALSGDGFGDTPLHWAAFKGHLECVRTILKYSNTESASVGCSLHTLNLCSFHLPPSRLTISPTTTGQKEQGRRDSPALGRNRWPRGVRRAHP